MANPQDMLAFAKPWELDFTPYKDPQGINLIVLLHGNDAGPEMMDGMKKTIEKLIAKREDCRILVPKLWTAETRKNFDFVAQGKILKQFFDDYFEKECDKKETETYTYKLHFIGFSLGGATLQAFLSEVDLSNATYNNVWATLASVKTINSPLYGFDPECGAQNQFGYSRIGTKFARFMSGGKDAIWAKRSQLARDLLKNEQHEKNLQQCKARFVFGSVDFFVLHKMTIRLISEYMNKGGEEGKDQFTEKDVMKLFPDTDDQGFHYFKKFMQGADDMPAPCRKAYDNFKAENPNEDLFTEIMKRTNARKRAMLHDGFLPLAYQLGFEKVEDINRAFKVIFTSENTMVIATEHPLINKPHIAITVCSPAWKPKTRRHDLALTESEFTNLFFDKNAQPRGSVSH